MEDETSGDTGRAREPPLRQDTHTQDITLKKSHSRNHTQEMHATGGAGKAWDCQALSLSGLLTRALGLLTNSYSNTGGRAPYIGLEPITLAISNN